MEPTKKTSAPPMPPPPKRTFEELGFWVGGLNSLLAPYEINKLQYAYAENVLTRGGIPQTRPGLRYVAELQGENLQGFTLFKPRNSSPKLVAAVDGKVYYADLPFFVWNEVEGISLSPTAPFVVFETCLKSVKRDLGGALEIVNPYSVLIIQDGVSTPHSWNGLTAKKLRPGSPYYETPKGLWMEWANSRLWVASGSRVYASDIGDPESNSEDTYLAERSAFELGDECTGLIQTTDLTGLLAFTETKTFAFQSSIRTRSQWSATPNFQQLILPSIGCVAGRSAINIYGLTHWFSLDGLVSLNSALSSQRDSSIQTIDGKMMRSKAYISSKPSGVCCASFENIMLVSVPSGNRWNAHTWIKDQAPSGAAGEEGNTGGPNSIWSSVWTGVRPVEWATATIGGRGRAFFAAYDKTAKNNTRIHIWEAFDPNRTDNDGGRITCQLETALISLPAKKQFAFAEIDICEILGEVDLKIYFGGLKGPWIQVYDNVLQAEEGSMGSEQQPLITESSLLQAFKPQSRTIKTTDFSIQSADCVPESSDAPGIDKALGLLFVWKGRMGVQRVKLWMTETSESPTGGCGVSEEGNHSAINESGEKVI